MWEIFTPTLWVCFSIYTTWYLTSAKRHAPISTDDAQTLWKIHRKNNRCNARKWREIRRRGKIVGFECQCGYKHLHKRPLVGYAPAPDAQPETSAFDKLHTSYKST